MQLTEDYIVGLVDGEGGFTAFVRNPNTFHHVKRRVNAELRFYIKLIAIDKSILDALKDYFHCGSVYFQKDNRNNHQDCYRFEVSSRKPLQEIIILFFKKNPLRFPSKRKDFIIFCQMFDMIAAKAHLTNEGLLKLFELKQNMH